MTSEEKPAEAPAMAATPRRRAGALPGWIIVLVFTVFFGTLAGLWYLASQPENGVRLEQLEEEVRNDLPPGSSRDQIRAWLDSRGFNGHGDMVDTGNKRIGYRVTISNDTWMEHAQIVIVFRFERGAIALIDIFRQLRHD